MERLDIFALVTLSLAFLALVPNMECHVRPPISQRPLCGSQFAVVNHACSFFPPATAFAFPLPLPPPVVPSVHDEEHRHHGGHGHGHGRDKDHRHKHGHDHGRRQWDHKPSERLENCCRWAEQVDSECVCEMLAHLPGFLPRPAHKYTVRISESCSVTYTCSGPRRKQIVHSTLALQIGSQG